MLNFLYKDQILDYLAVNANVAQFVSFSPDLQQRYMRIFGYTENMKFKSMEDSILALLEASPEHSVNVRSFMPNQPQSHEFIYGLTSVSDVAENLKRLSTSGLFTIVNETVSVEDGGVSGVLQNGMVECAPGVIPRFVEKSKDPIASLPLDLSIKLLEIVYGFTPHIKYSQNERVEFSIHPIRRGCNNSHTIIWEVETVDNSTIQPFYIWPTSFSRLIGDKAYGLLLAFLLDLPVPRTTVFSKNPILGIFSFGTATGRDEVWMRTCPKIQEPGKYTTVRGWRDPYALMVEDDPEGTALASCLAQQEVPAKYSGALISTAEGPIIEGVEGFGDSFMLGAASPVELPESIKKDVLSLYDDLTSRVGPVRFEWVHDGKNPWVLQLHPGMTQSLKRVVYPGEFSNSIEFDVNSGLKKLREIIQLLAPNTGIIVKGNIGMSSHIADVLRKAKIPSTLA